MSGRDELAGVIYTARWVDGIKDINKATDAAIADAILAAGYRKPRTITTAEELDKLPVGSVILDPADWLFRKQDSRRFMAAGSSGGYSPAAIELPAMVLYEPTA